MCPKIVDEYSYDSGIPREDFKIRIPCKSASDLWQGNHGAIQFDRLRYIQSQLVEIFRLYEIRNQYIESYKKTKGKPNPNFTSPSGIVLPEAFSCTLEDVLQGDLHSKRALAIGDKGIHFASMNLISNIRRFLDIHLQILCVEKLGGKKADGSIVISYDSIGKILNKKENGSTAKRARILLWGSEEFSGPYYDFIKLIDTISNCMKHHYMHELIINYIDEDKPSILAFEAKNKEPENVVYHKHQAWQIVSGFQITVDQLIGNFE